jgi:hypothetical protein
MLQSFGVRLFGRPTHAEPEHTAYPLLKPSPLERELDEVYTPTLFEMGFAEKRTRDPIPKEDHQNPQGIALASRRGKAPGVSQEKYYSVCSTSATAQLLLPGFDTTVGFIRERIEQSQWQS